MIGPATLSKNFLTGILHTVTATFINSATWHFRKQNKPVSFSGYIIYPSLELPHPLFDIYCRILSKYLKKNDFAGKYILDFNAATGWLSLDLTGRGAIVSAFDNRQVAHSAMQKNFDLNHLQNKIQIISAKKLAAGTAGKQYDFIFIQHVGNTKGHGTYTAAEIKQLAKRNLKPGGKILFFNDDRNFLAEEKSDLWGEFLQLRSVIDNKWVGSKLYEMVRVDAANSG